MKRPHVSATVCWVYGEPHAQRLHRAPTAAIVVKVIDAERGVVDLQAFRQDCHGSFLVRGVEYGDDGEPGTWHWPGE